MAEKPGGPPARITGTAHPGTVEKGAASGRPATVEDLEWWRSELGHPVAAVRIAAADNILKALRGERA